MSIRVKTIYAFLASIIVSSSAVFAQEQTTQNREKYVVDEVVAVVGSSAILLSDLITTENYIKQDYMQRGYSSTNTRGEALENLLTQKLLMTQAAIDSLEVNDGMIEMQAEQKLQELIESRGSAKELEKFYNKPVFSIKEIIRTKMRESEMASMMQNQIQSGIKVTPAEVQRFYRKSNKDSLPIIPEQYIISKIEKLPSMDDDRKLDVKEDLLEIRDRILNGANFSALARMYSDDIASAIRGGELETSPSNVFSQNFKDAVETIPVGQLSEVIETEYGYHILEVMEKRGSQYKVRHILMKVKFDAEDKQNAMVQLDSIAKEIREGNLDFVDAVDKFSDDEESRINEGIVTNNVFERYGAKYKSNRFAKEDLGSLYDKIAQLKVADISNAFDYVNQEAEESVLIVKLMEIIPSHTANIDDDYTIIEEMAINEKRNDIFQDWLGEKIKNIYVKIEEPYKDIKIKDSRWIK